MTFAVIKTGGKQYLVKEGDRLKISKLNAPDGGDIKFDNVLLLSDKDTKVGAPLIDSAKVTAKVLKQGRAKKIVVFHYHSKTRYKKKAGHRQHFTEIKIEEIK